MVETTVQHNREDTPLLQDFPPLLRNRNFILLWLGYVVSALADRVHWLVMLTLLCTVVLGMKGLGSQQTAQLNLAMFVPFLILAPLGGLISDRLPRRMVMISGDLIRVVIVLVARTILLHGAQSKSFSVDTLLWLVFGSEIILSSVGEIFYVARAAILPNLVHPRQLLQANAMISAAGTIFSLIGFILGDMLIKWRLEYAMYVDGAAFALSAICMMAMRLAKGTDVSQTASASTGLISDARIGASYLKNHSRPFQVIGLEMMFFAISAVVFNALPSLLTDHFKLPQSDFGIFMGMAGLGMVAGAMAISRARQGIPKEVGIAWATVLVGGGLLAASFCVQWQGLLASLMVGSFFAAIMFISVDTLLQRVVPDYIRGRVMAVRDMLTTSGLILMTVPIAIWPHANAYTHDLLFAVAIVTTLLGLGLVAIYYKRQPLPVVSALARRLVGMYMIIWHRWHMDGACRIPTSGAVLVVANRTGDLDSLALCVASRRRLVRFLVSEKYFNLPLVRGILRALGCIELRDNGHQFHAMRAILRHLQAGDVVAVFAPPLATNDSQSANDRNSAIAFMAMRSGASVVPAYIAETGGHESIGQDVLRRKRATVRFGAPITPTAIQMADRSRPALDIFGGQIQDAIAALRQRSLTHNNY